MTDVEIRKRNEDLSEFFQCMICLENLNNPHLCPYCSNPSCYKCITKWLRIEPVECPFCRRQLMVKKLVKCSWLLDLGSKLESLGFHILREKNDKEHILSHKKNTDEQNPSTSALTVASLNTELTDNTKVYYRWQKSHRNFEMPADALLVGTDSDGAQIYVGRAWHEGDHVTVKIIPKNRSASITFCYEEILISSFDILCGKGFKWVPSSRGKVPPNAISIGETSDDEKLYIGRGELGGSLVPGKIQPSHFCISIPYGGEEVIISAYEVLVTQ